MWDFLAEKKSGIYFADIPFISPWTYVLRQNRLTPLYSKANTELNPPSPPFLFQTLKCQDYFHGICREIYLSGFYRYVFTNKTFCIFVLNFFVFLILLQEYVKPVFLIMFSQEYVKFELPPNQPITVSIGVDVKDIPKVPSKLLKTSELMKSWVSGLWQGLFNNAQRLLHCQVVWLKVKANVYNFFHKRTDFSIKIDITLWFCLFSKTTNSFGF